MNIYRIHESKTGNVLVNSIELDDTQIESLSSDSPEGHFMSDRVEELAEIGSQSVYAILL